MYEWYACLFSHGYVQCSPPFPSALDADDYYNANLANSNRDYALLIPVFKYQPTVMKKFFIKSEMIRNVRIIVKE